MSVYIAELTLLASNLIVYLLYMGIKYCPSLITALPGESRCAFQIGSGYERSLDKQGNPYKQGNCEPQA